ncbi:hypothetical protein Hypma_014026 [Hypsizygus marmoreus]|uniref:Uncharacterized protein n=1 Tax=Hypsizygus marmoreus TaxID=39966 RepID=A0A369KEF1_HYPMA|nr:hypothetical protein Hypma_014026 [Hypsizygus marmoreus]
MSASDAREYEPDELSIHIDNHYANMDDYTALTRLGGVWDVLESTLAAPRSMKNKVRLYIHFALFSNLSWPWTKRNVGIGCSVRFLLLLEVHLITLKLEIFAS